jgi:hypothetical protein
MTWGILHGLDPRSGHPYAATASKPFDSLEQRGRVRAGLRGRRKRCKALLLGGGQHGRRGDRREPRPTAIQAFSKALGRLRLPALQVVGVVVGVIRRGDRARLRAPFCAWASSASTSTASAASTRRSNVGGRPRGRGVARPTRPVPRVRLRPAPAPRPPRPVRPGAPGSRRSPGRPRVGHETGWGNGARPSPRARGATIP